MPMVDDGHGWCSQALKPNFERCTQYPLMQQYNGQCGLVCFNAGMSAGVMSILREGFFCFYQVKDEHSCLLIMGFC